MNLMRKLPLNLPKIAGTAAAMLTPSGIVGLVFYKYYAPLAQEEKLLIVETDKKMEEIERNKDYLDLHPNFFEDYQRWRAARLSGNVFKKP